MNTKSHWALYMLGFSCLFITGCPISGCVQVAKHAASGAGHAAKHGGSHAAHGAGHAAKASSHGAAHGANSSTAADKVIRGLEFYEKYGDIIELSAEMLWKIAETGGEISYDAELDGETRRFSTNLTSSEVKDLRNGKEIEVETSDGHTLLLRANGG